VHCPGGKDCAKNHVSGKWSTIYDQAFMVELENNMRFIANFKYSLKEDVSPNPTQELFQKFADLKSGDYNKFDSQCDKTMVGFVQEVSSGKNKQSMMQHKVQCFYGM
jgi:hypothetical protein